MTEAKQDGHRLAAGQVIQSKYKGLGGRQGQQLLDPALVKGLIMGFPDAGKSHLLESNPDAYIINCDGTSTSNPDTVATIYPGFNAEGRACDENGKAFTLTYQHISDIVGRLEEMAKRDEERPTTVIFDSLTTLMELAKEWVPENLFASTKGKQFRHLDGQMAYSTMYAELLKLFNRVSSAGYGCYVVVHLKRNIRNAGKENEKEVILPSISGNFAQQLLAFFELCLSVECEMKYTSKGYQRIVTLGATFPDLLQQNMYKSRVPIKLIVPEKNGWAAFVDAYYKGIKNTSEAGDA